ncbi:hydrolase, putative [Entamoeba histolytica HM-1:IMSS-B]|uniref:HAD hydrolase, family IA, variant 3 n=6 Tax=Entamoeba histolytica TaxID=5759 RepID=C4LU14_ENTH1|nr:HAD hydrolase, family IA, variant 3 [Entamoeba histolytica HM-1:IMSS]EMD47270.1 HAD hydrolase family IA variant 3, putative [Entamoeba histolytica KU27]EMH73460.1 hydrolase, putative [Entamoeba histolytica HM-1:IMSS-B]EMS13562.1 HAD hydrolase, family IA, variant 3, putative [Entamoeba histolytica HM-3:IMSS]ENY62393.1 HAD hydrolase, family IA, variant 3, putative [Entamoeba histolytica HM-1:IMSS-A]GAT92081.1 had hydrolase family ia variant 3 [Entamoeba histolytica]|eukprot:XP_651725.1 HAD hydrolase, family IA, variant 3 [Entamoeba histolytica HM-1:IMSS]
MKYKAIVMDFDGTIVDGMSAWINMYYAFDQKYNIILSQEKKDRIYVGSVRSVATNYLSLFKHLNDHFTIDSLTRYFVDNSREGTLTSPPIKGAIEFITEMHEKNIPIAIASSSTVPTIQEFLKKHNISQCIQEIVVGSDVKHCKPAADIYIEASHRLGHDINDTVVFEDSVLALTNAKKVGFKSVLISHTKVSPESHDIQIEDYFSPSLKELF